MTLGQTIPSLSLFFLASSKLTLGSGSLGAGLDSSLSSLAAAFFPFLLVLCFALAEPDAFFSSAGFFGVVSFSLVPVLGVLAG